MRLPVDRLAAADGNPAESDKPVSLSPAPADGVLPDDFYSSTNLPTSLLLGDTWIDVEDVMMDKAIVVHTDQKRAICRPILEIKKGDLVVVGDDGIRIPAAARAGRSGVFHFMSELTSPERPVPFTAKKVAERMTKARKQGKKIVAVAGPAVVHSGAVEPLARMIRNGYVTVLLAGNALAVHDIEYALYGTSLGMSLSSDKHEPRGNRNHMKAINEVLRHGSIKAMVEKGALKSGIMYECIKNSIPFALAGSIRDDGPIPEVIRDVVQAQAEYRRLLDGAEVALMLASGLHSIAVGNMLPSKVDVIVVDINPAIVTKLIDRGTAQTFGIVSNVGGFLDMLEANLGGSRSTTNP
jgi:lysine-ketoglutarate reductase/saccharopine dehydrogenase-like protein (TIGR00300 family)